MNNYISFANISIETIPMEKAGVSYSFDYYTSMPFQPNPIIINLDLRNLQSKVEETFSPSFIFFDNKYYYLNTNLSCVLSNKENVYTIYCPSLNIKVCGKTKEEVVSAFNFSFHSLFENFANEDDKKLSSDAKKLKYKLRSLVD